MDQISDTVTAAAGVDKLFSELDESFNYTSLLRRELIDKVRKVASEVQINPDIDGATKTEAKLHILDGMDNLLKSLENASATKIKLTLQKKETETNDAVKKNITELFKTVLFGDTLKNAGYGTTPGDDANSKLMDILTQSSEPVITPEELAE